MPKHTWSWGEDVTPGDPWSFQRWAYQTKVGSPARKAVLMVLATMADSSTGRCEPLQETLAEACETSDRTIREHLKQMESAGIIARRRQHRYDGSRRGDEFLLLAPWVTEWPDGVKIDLPEESSAPPTGTTASPLPEDFDQSNRKPASAQERPEGTTKKNGTAEKRASARARAGEQAQTLPDGFPDELKPHAREAFKVLRETAVQFNAKEVTPRGVGLAIMGHPGCRFVSTAFELASWAQTAERPIKDVVGTYRTFLDRAPVYAGIENLEPPTIAASAGGNVHQMRRRGGGGTPWSAAEMLELGRQMQ